MITTNAAGDRARPWYDLRVDALFASCSPGLEAPLAAELAELGLKKLALRLGPAEERGGVRFSGGQAELMRANLRLRCAERVLLRFASFPARDFAALVRGVTALPWERFLSPGRPVAVRVESRRSRLYHEKAAAERVREGIGARLGLAPPVGDESAQRVEVELDGDGCRLSIDGSGEPLHRRGWRRAGAKAPLRETLAAALIRLSGWDRRSPLLDPFCGSGTIAIEAAELAAGLAPGRARRFVFMDWPGFDARAWERELALSASTGDAPAIRASDRDAGAIEAARSNAERAGVAGRVEFSVRALSAAEPPRGPGCVVSNPPYGVRVSAGKDLRPLYAGLGQLLRARCPGWSATLLCASPSLVRATGLPFEAGLSTLNGGIGVRVYRCRAI